jgi:hypothetical protein
MECRNTASLVVTMRVADESIMVEEAVVRVFKHGQSA